MASKYLPGAPNNDTAIELNRLSEWTCQRGTSAWRVCGRGTLNVCVVRGRRFSFVFAIIKNSVNLPSTNPCRRPSEEHRLFVATAQGETRNPPTRALLNPTSSLTPSYWAVSTMLRALLSAILLLWVLPPIPGVFAQDSNATCSQNTWVGVFAIH